MKPKQDKKFTKEAVRDEKYVTAIPTEITLEEASPDNPFHTQNMYIHGYEHLELAQQRSFSDMIFLMFRGELPDSSQKQLFDKLLCCLINPGPRYPATRAAMNAGIARTKIQHVLPIGLSVASGAYLGSEDVFNSMQFLSKHVQKNADEVAQSSWQKSKFEVTNSPLVAPGFGSFYGGADTYAQKLADFLIGFNPDGIYVNFARALIRYWHKQNPAIGWLTTGVTAAVLCDLGFSPRAGCTLFQMAIAPGLSAHAVEKATRPVTEMPFVPDEKYSIEPYALASSAKESS